MTRRKTCSTASALTGTVAHLIATSGSLYFLLLVSRDAYSSLARNAHARLRELITQRLQRLATALVAVLGFDDGEAGAEIARLTDAAVPVVLRALTTYRPRCPQEFACWLERRIDQALRGQPLDSPPSAAVPPRIALALQQLPIPSDERKSVLTAIVRQLTATERCVLQYRTEPHATWSHIATRMGTTVHYARALHRRAMSTAQQVAFDLVVQPRPVNGGEFQRAA